MYLKEVVREMEQRHQNSLEAHQKMASAFDEHLLSGEIPDNTLADVSLFYLTKFHKSLLSLRILVISGMEEDSIVILRTMVEAAIGLVYLSKEPTKRLPLFIEYSAIQRNRMLNAALKHYPDEKIFDDETIDEIRNNFSTYKGNYKTRHSWSGESLHDMARNVEMEYWYEMVYQSDSSYVHTNISASSKLMFHDDEGPVLAVGPQSFDATDILSKACEMSRIILFYALTNLNKSTERSIEAWNQSRELLEIERNAKKKNG